MNTVAMEFVMRIDEMLYETVLPASQRRQANTHADARRPSRRRPLRLYIGSPHLTIRRDS